MNTPLLPRAIHTPLVQEFTLGFQYEFAPQWVLELDYAGSRGINLTDYNHNQNGAQIITPATDTYGLCQPAGTDGSTTGLPICNTANNASFRVPVLGYEPIGLQQSDFNGSSNYNSLQATVRHQFGHGLSMQAAYTWDKNLSDIFYSNSANINDALALKTKPSPNGPAHGQWGPVSFDRFQRLVVNYSYDLPFGKGTEGIENKLINGWNVSGVTIAQTGNPLTFIGGGSGGAYGTNQQLIFEGVTTAEICSNFGNGQLKNGGGATSHVVGGATGYFNTAAFACQAPLVPYGDPGYGPPGPFQIPAATDYGNSGVGIVTGPGQFNWDYFDREKHADHGTCADAVPVRFLQCVQSPAVRASAGRQLRHGRIRERRKLYRHSNRQFYNGHERKPAADSVWRALLLLAEGSAAKVPRMR